MRRLKLMVPVVAILLVATYFRSASLGLEPLYTDDAVISLGAVRIARHGQPTLLGPVMSVGLWHSPLTYYLYAVPYTLSIDPRVARLFTGLVNVIAVALVFFIGRRFFGYRAGLLAVLLYAVHREAVGIGRNIWNPNLGAPFVLLYVGTALLGYYADRRWARLAHLPALSLAMQFHLTALSLAPITALLALSAMRHRPARWRAIAGETMVSGLLGLLLLVPWALGLYLARLDNSPQAVISTLPNRGFEYVFSTMYEGLGYWRRHYTQVLIPGLVALGSIWLAARGLRRREGLPGLTVVLAFFLLPVVSLLLNAKYRGHYLTPEFPNAFLILGAFIGGAAPGAGRMARSVHPHRGPVGSPGTPFTSPFGGVRGQAPATGDAPEGPLRGGVREHDPLQPHGASGAGVRAGRPWRGLSATPFLRWLVPPLVTLLVGLHLIYNFTPLESIFGPRHSLDDQIAAITLTRQRAAESGREALLLASPTGGEPPYAWELLNEGQSSRVIWHGQPLPLPPQGAVMVGFADNETWPSIFTGGQRFGDYFRIVEVPAAAHFRPDVAPAQPIRVANGITILGVLSDGRLPHAGQPWTVYLLWRVDEPGSRDFTLFVHLINANSDKYAQLDVPGLPAGTQRRGDYALSRLDFLPGEGLPPDGPLYLRVGVYDASGQFSVLDAAGNAAGDYGLIQLRGQAEALTVWDGASLNALTTNSPLTQGPPLEVRPTWQLTQNAQHAPQVRWRLLAPGGRLAFEQTTPLGLGPAPEGGAAEVFLTELYQFRIPSDLAPGDYRLELTPVDARGDAQGAPWSSPILISARERRFEALPMSHRVDAAFADQIRLLGYDVKAAGTAVELLLHWQAMTRLDSDYKYFVHVWQDGQVVAQVDSMPGGNQYLTSWWAPGEVVSETVSLDLAALSSAPYTLTTGFYEPLTGERLPVVLDDGTRPPDAWVTLRTVGP